MRGVYWESVAWDDYVEFQSQKQILNRINTLIKDIRRNGYQCSYGKPEMLNGNMTKVASVRIDKKNRLVFTVKDEQINILSCKGHYGDH